MLELVSFMVIKLEKSFINKNEALALIVIIEYLYRHPGYCDIYNNK